MPSPTTRAGITTTASLGNQTGKQAKADFYSPQGDAVYVQKWQSTDPEGQIWQAVAWSCFIDEEEIGQAMLIPAEVYEQDKESAMRLLMMNAYNAIDNHREVNE